MRADGAGANRDGADGDKADGNKADGDKADGDISGKKPFVFIAVSTPGVNAPGQLFRGDGAIALNLKPFMTTTLPSVAEVAARILGLLERPA